MLTRSTDADGDLVYNVQFDEEDNPKVLSECVVDADYILRGIPHANVKIMDRPETMDVFLKTAFRQEMHVPKDFYPMRWMKQKVRSRGGKNDEAAAMGEEFKRKVPNTSATRGVVAEKEVQAVEQ